MDRINRSKRFWDHEHNIDDQGNYMKTDLPIYS